MTTPPRAKRHSLYFLSVFDGRTGELLGQLADLNQEGINIVSPSPLKTHERYVLRIILPQQGHSERCLELEAESRWTAPEPETGQHTTGFHIMLLREEQRSVIDQLVNEFGYSRISEVKLPSPRNGQLPAGPGPIQRFLRGLFTR